MAECGLILPDGAPPPPDGISAASWLVADATSGEVLAARDPHDRHRPASTIKLLTALLAAQRLPADQVVTATQADASQEGSRAGIGPGGTYTVRQLLTGLLLVSGNDAAHALAEQLGGVAATVEQMNKLAATLGALDTRTASPSGLDGPGMSTSAYDLALVFRQALRNPLLFELLNTAQTDFPGFGDRPGFRMGNDNRLLANYPGAMGGKTGFTDDARHTYLGAAIRDGRPLIVVLLRGEQRPVPMWEQATHLLDYGFTLPRGRGVGVLVDGAPPPIPPSPTATAGPLPTAAPDQAAQHGSMASREPGSPAITPAVRALWIGLPMLLLGVLTALVLRLRRR
jgi:D-alanyl-D-alanine carboxypeptidase (penicillin-binding protein 5/6)